MTLNNYLPNETDLENVKATPQAVQSTNETSHQPIDGLDYKVLFEEGDCLIESEDGPEFAIEKNGVYTMHYDKDEQEYFASRKSLCTPLYVKSVKRNRTEGDLVVRIAYRLQNEWYETDIPSSEINEGIASKLTRLGVVINPTPGNKSHIAHYIMLLIKETKFESIHDHVGFRSNQETHNLDSSIMFNHHSQELERNSDGKVSVKESTVSHIYQKALMPKGDLEELRTNLHPLLEYNEVKFALAIGFSSMLHGYLKLFKPDLLNYIVHFHGNSSTGKTTAARLAVSVNGNPFKSPLKASWNWTLNALLKVIENNYGLTVLFDESSMASRDAADLIYQFSDGEERGRLNRSAGQRERSKFATICVSTGEQSLKDLDRRGRNVQNAGLSVRAIEVTDIAFMPNREVAESVAQIVQQYHGLLGPVFAEKLLHYHPEQIIETWETVRSEYEQSVGVQSNYVNRLSPMFATLEMAFSIAHNHVLLTDEHTEMDETEKLVFRNFLLDIFKAQLTNIDHSGAAYDRLKNFIVENIRKFKYSDYLPNTTQTFGKITMKAKSRGYEVFILQDILEKFFREAGYTSPLVVLKEWRGKGLVKSEQDRLTARVKGLSDGRLTGYCIIFEQGTFDDYLQDSSGIQSSLFDAQLSKPRISRLQPHEIKRTKPIISEEPSMNESIDLSIDVELPPQDEDDI
ncbi:DUF927 domain-containing protein [Exiguobacterium profundum]|uniref:DUF927 domain-containing protein n=1 Tax=Exiguobacterium profundum TaxID=307643 RepID=UPI0029C54692|nr:DUF927 domain-containing protein [Exiguobacterium profundum]MDX5979683.1 DUF927 domain-containing protein [Exiguobacterium profundum]